MAARGGGVARGADVVGAHGLQTGHGGTRAHSPVVQAPDGHHGRARYGPAPLAPLAVRGAHASAVGALQAEGGSGAPEAGEGAGGAPFGGGSEDGAGALTTSRGVRSGERDRVRAVSRRSLICVRSLLDVCFTTV